jgi:hypothetical protein
MTEENKIGRSFPSLENAYYDPKFDGATHPNFQTRQKESAEVAQQETVRVKKSNLPPLRGHQRFYSNQGQGFDIYGAPDPKMGNPKV